MTRIIREALEEIVALAEMDDEFTTPGTDEYTALERARSALTANPATVANRQDGNRPLPFDRDTLGRMVREAWVRWAEMQPNPKPSWLVPYDDLAEADKEADRQIGEAVARWTLIGDASADAFAAAPTPPTVQPSGEWQAGTDWRLMNTAPKDGTRIRIVVVHRNAMYAKDPAEEGWIAVHEARWIDHNGGGWTWDGLAGMPVAWMPLVARWTLIGDASADATLAPSGEWEAGIEAAAKVAEKIGRQITAEWTKDRGDKGYPFAFWHNELREAIRALRPAPEDGGAK